MSFSSNAPPNDSITAEQVDFIYEWVDQFPISRPKRSITRDFADGLNIAEISKTCFPILVDLRHYNRGNSRQHHLENWATLNKKVFRPLGFEVDTADVMDVVQGVPGAIEHVLLFIYHQFQSHTEETIAQQKLQRKRDTESALIHSSGNAMASQGNFGTEFSPQHYITASRTNSTPRHSSRQSQYQQPFSNSHFSHYISPPSLSPSPRASAVFPPFISASAAFSEGSVFDSDFHSTHQRPNSRSRSRSRVPTTPTTRSISRRESTSRIRSRSTSRTGDRFLSTSSSTIPSTISSTLGTRASTNYSSSGPILTPAAAYQPDSFRGIMHSNAQRQSEIQTPMSRIRVAPAAPSSRVPFATTARGGALSFSAETLGESYNTFTAPQYMTGGVTGGKVGFKGTLRPTTNLESDEQSSMSGRARVVRPKSIAYSILAKNQIARYPPKSHTLPDSTLSSPSSFEPFQSLRSKIDNKEMEDHEQRKIPQSETTPKTIEIGEKQKDKNNEIIEQQEHEQEQEQEQERQALCGETEIHRLTLRVKLLESQIEDYKDIIAIKDTQFARLVHVLRSGKSESGPLEPGLANRSSPSREGNDEAQLHLLRERSRTEVNAKRDSMSMPVTNPDLASDKTKSFISPHMKQDILGITTDLNAALPEDIDTTPSQVIPPTSTPTSTLVSGSISQIASRALERRQVQRHMEKLYTGGAHGALKSNSVTPSLVNHKSISPRLGTARDIEREHVSEYADAEYDNDEDNNRKGNLVYHDDERMSYNDLNDEYASMNMHGPMRRNELQYHYDEDGSNNYTNAYVKDEEVNDEEDGVEHKYYSHRHQPYIQTNMSTNVSYDPKRYSQPFIPQKLFQYQQYEQHQRHAYENRHGRKPDSEMYHDDHESYIAYNLSDPQDQQVIRPNHHQQINQQVHQGTKQVREQRHVQR